MTPFIQQETPTCPAWITTTGICLLLAGIAGYTLAGSIEWVVIPFAYLFLLLLYINWKIAYFILIGCIPVSIHIYLAGKTLSTSLPDEPMMWIFLLFFLFSFILNPRLIPSWWWKNPIVFIIVLQFLWLIVAVIYSKELFYSIKFLLAKCWFMVAYMILPIFVFKTRKDLKTGFWLFFGSVVLTMVIIFIRHAAYDYKYMGIEKAIASLYYNHVDYSTVLSMFFPVVCIAYSLIERRKKWARGLMLTAILFFILAIGLAYARAAMLAVIFSALIYLAIRLRLVQWIMPAFYGMIIFLVSFMIQDNRYIEFRPDFEKTYTHRDFGSHIIATFRGEDMSSMERLYRWIAAVRMSNDRPLTGYGPNSFYHHYKPYAVTMFETYVSRNDERSTTHNYFLFMLVEQGWPAMILYAILIAVVLVQAQKIYYRFHDPFYKKVTLALAMMFGAGFVNNFFSELLETHKVGALFFLSISLLVILDRKSRMPEKTTPANA